MKVVINACFGGFGLSPRAVKRLAELNGRECHFYVTGRDAEGRLDIHKHQLATMEEAGDGFCFHAFDVPNIDEVLPPSQPDADGLYKTYNAAYSAHCLNSGRDIDRSDPKLIQVIEELGEAANGHCAKLKIVEIPDGVQYEIDEYDGNESIHEVHRSWN